MGGGRRQVGWQVHERAGESEGAQESKWETWQVGWVNGQAGENVGRLARTRGRMGRLAQTRGRMLKQTRRSSGWDVWTCLQYVSCTVYIYSSHLVCIVSTCTIQLYTFDCLNLLSLCLVVSFHLILVPGRHSMSRREIEPAKPIHVL